jgi:hypothetical protein
MTSSKVYTILHKIDIRSLKYNPSATKRNQCTALILLLLLRNLCRARHQRLTPITAATWEAEIRITVQGQLR